MRAAARRDHPAPAPCSHGSFWGASNPAPGIRMLRHHSWCTLPAQGFGPTHSFLITNCFGPETSNLPLGVPPCVLAHMACLTDPACGPSTFPTWVCAVYMPHMASPLVPAGSLRRCPGRVTAPALWTQRSDALAAARRCPSHATRPPRAPIACQSADHKQPGPPIARIRPGGERDAATIRTWALNERCAGPGGGEGSQAGDVWHKATVLWPEGKGEGGDGRTGGCMGWGGFA